MFKITTFGTRGLFQTDHGLTQMTDVGNDMTQLAQSFFFPFPVSE